MLNTALYYSKNWRFKFSSPNIVLSGSDIYIETTVYCAEEATPNVKTAKHCVTGPLLGANDIDL